MSFSNIEVTLSKSEHEQLIRSEVSKSFPNHVADKITVNNDGTVSVKLKPYPSGYFDR
jgi:hypothetical protein